MTLSAKSACDANAFVGWFIFFSGVN